MDTFTGKGHAWIAAWEISAHSIPMYESSKAVTQHSRPLKWSRNIRLGFIHTQTHKHTHTRTHTHTHSHTDTTKNNNAHSFNLSSSFQRFSALHSILGTFWVYLGTLCLRCIIWDNFLGSNNFLGFTQNEP